MSFRLPPHEAAKLDALTLPGVGRGQAAAAIASADWTPEDTERWLTDYPLPATFKWNGERAYPRYTAKKGYGFWLRTAGPYHPALRGLFGLCHAILAGLRAGIDPMPGQEQLAALLQKHAGQQLALSVEDLAAPATVNPAENLPGAVEPASNPPETDRFPTANQDGSDEEPAF